MMIILRSFCLPLVLTQNTHILPHHHKLSYQQCCLQENEKKPQDYAKQNHKMLT